MHRSFASLVVMITLLLSAAAQTVPPVPRVANPTEAKVMQAFQRGDFSAARALSAEWTKADPGNLRAWEEFARACSRLKDYPAEVSGLQRALELRPDAPHLLAQIMSAYTFGSFDRERDQTRAHIRQLVQEGRLPRDYYYVVDTFDVGRKRVEVSEFPELTGHTEFPNNRYHFDVYDNDGIRLDHIVLESNDDDQRKWAGEHPAAAAAGTRVFSLDWFDGHTPDAQDTYKFYDGEPSYEAVKEDVRKVLSGELKKLARDEWGRRPAP